MNSIKRSTLALVLALALAPSHGASAAEYLFNFQFDPLNAFGATNIVYVAGELDPASLSYVSGSVNGATSPGLVRTISEGAQRGYEFQALDYAAPLGTVANIFFSVSAPLAAGQTYETDLAGRGVRISGAISYRYTTGRLTITDRAGPAVPEPDTWALMIGGFGLAGLALRRRVRPAQV